MLPAASVERAIGHETLRRGQVTAVPNLQAALGEVDTTRGSRREVREPAVVRLDGGLAPQRCARGARTAAPGGPSPVKAMSARPVPRPPARWSQDAAVGYADAESGRGYQEAVLVTTLTDLPPAAWSAVCDGRALMETTWCQDRQGLGWVKAGSAPGMRSRLACGGPAWPLIGAREANGG
jgi:hypothetical protein